MTGQLLPMLASPAAPFDAEDYLFEVKWDGVRALAASESGGRWRLWGRQGADYTHPYPELAVLARLPAGTVVDGELVVVHDGRADFRALLRRHQRADPLGAAVRKAQPAVTYVLFDLLFHQGQSLLSAALLRRRTLLRALLLEINEPALVYSDGVEGCGREFFARVVAQGHEGVVAKQRASRYQPGRRSRSWLKIKPSGILPCVVIGYLAGREGVRCLLVATLHAGLLRLRGTAPYALGHAGHAGATARRTPPVVSGGELCRAGVLGRARAVLPGEVPRLDGARSSPGRRLRRLDRRHRTAND